MTNIQSPTPAPPAITARSQPAVDGVVAIGRNEGERLRKCLESVVKASAAVVYVDSGSTDGSVEMARAMGVTVVELDLSRPFTAARARNGGFERLLGIVPDLEYVQFVDGDCEVVSDWMSEAEQALDADAKLAVVCGRRRERHPEASIYNRLCDIEWDTPVGEAGACGGDAMMRAAALKQVGGYDASLIAGEEPEMCVRLRKLDWKIHRIDAEMTLHDAAMTRFGQWWKRAVRGGHAYTEGYAMHGGAPMRHWAKESRSITIWGIIVPILALALAWPTRGWSLLLFLGYLLLAWRSYRLERRRHSAADARPAANFNVLGKFPQAIGQIKYVLARLAGRKSTLIEYKGASSIEPAHAATTKG